MMYFMDGPLVGGCSLTTLCDNKDD